MKDDDKDVEAPGALTAVEEKERVQAKEASLISGNDVCEPQILPCFRKLRGHAGPGMTTDEIMQLLRGE